MATWSFVERRRSEDQSSTDAWNQTNEKEKPTGRLFDTNESAVTAAQTKYPRHHSKSSGRTKLDLNETEELQQAKQRKAWMKRVEIDNSDGFNGFSGSQFRPGWVLLGWKQNDEFHRLVSPATFYSDNRLDVILSH